VAFRLTSPKPKLVENDIERQCLDRLRYAGYYPVRLQSGLFKTPDRSARFIHIGEIGLPDYIVAHPERPAFFLEVKRPGGKLSDQQQMKIMELERSYRLRVAVVDRYEALESFLREHERPPP
jgi:hypothetical protein